jgi:hypothetical protein
MINKWRIGKDVHVSRRDVLRGNSPVFGWRDWWKPRMDSVRIFGACSRFEPSISRILTRTVGRVIAQAVSRWLPTAVARVRSQVRSCGILVDKVALGQVFSEYFVFPRQSSFHQLLHNHHRSSGAGTIGKQWPKYQVDSVSPHPERN